jgi:hypothetical protein
MGAEQISHPDASAGVPAQAGEPAGERETATEAPAASRLSLAAAAPWAVIAVAFVWWGLALRVTDLSQLSGYGLLTAVPPLYFLALLLLATGFAVAATRPQVQPRLLALHVVSLVVMLHATTAILYPEPRYAWTYKHLGVIDYIAVHGRVDRSIDIYHNWPGFFALNAWFSEATGLAPIDYAGWAQVFFGLANIAAIVFALRGVTRDPRLLWTAAWIFVVANWIGQEYLAPQAFGFVLVEIVIGLILRCAPPRGSPPTALGRLRKRMIDRAEAAALRGRPARDEEGLGHPISPPAAVAAGALCSLAVVVSHQLSPVMLIVSVAALTVLRRGPPLWVLAGLVVAEELWLGASFDFVSRHFQIVQVSANTTARPAGFGAHSLAGAALGADLSRAAIVLTVLLAGVGVVRRLRAGHWDLAPAALAVAPFLVLGIQSYEGEGPLRAFLFALPWLAFFVAAACYPAANARSTLRRAWPILAVSLLIGTGSLFGYFGQEMMNYIRPDDVAASRWYLDHAPARASLTFVAPNFPERLNARYSTHLESRPDLVSEPGFRPHLLGAADVPALQAILRSDDSPQRYVALTSSQERYARFYGLAPPGSFQRLAAALRASPDFKLVYQQGSASIFLYTKR